MFNKAVVQTVLKRTWELDNDPGTTADNNTFEQSSVISQLIFDIFGGEILKTHDRQGWHFYNRINGKRIDLTRSKNGKSSGAKRFEDIPSSPVDTYDYFEKEDYLTFFIKFIRTFEETVGLKKYRPLAS